MNKREERQVFDMAKQDIPFLKDLELVKHDDRPDFVLKDKNGRIIGLEHFRADVYRVVDESNFHVSGGHTVLDKSKNEVFQKYHSFSVDNTWTDQLLENATNDVLEIANDSLNMQRNYKYEDFLDNLRVGIHHGQYFDKSTPKPKIYPAFSFGLTNITSMDTYAEHREGKINILFNMQANQSKYDVSATKTMLKNERRKLDREERKHFDKVTKDFCK